jgi:hypothetical protein
MRSALAIASLLALLIPGALRADPPPEQLTLDFPTGAPILLPGALANSVERTCRALGGELGEVCVEIETNLTPLVTDSRGRITGSGAITISSTDSGSGATLSGSFSGTAAGSIKRRGERPAALQLKFDLDGELNVAGEGGPISIPARAKGSFKGTVNSAGLFVGEQIIELKSRGVRGGRFSVPVTPASLGSGAWQLQLVDIARDARNKLSGLGLVTLQGRPTPYNYALTGRYDAKRDQSSFKLKALRETRAAVRGTSLALSGLRLDESDGVLTVLGGALRYNLIGQSGTLSLPVIQPQP